MLICSGFNRCRIYQRENEECPIHRHQLEEQHVRACRTVDWHIQGQPHDQKCHSGKSRLHPEVIEGYVSQVFHEPCWETRVTEVLDTQIGHVTSPPIRCQKLVQLEVFTLFEQVERQLSACAQTSVFWSAFRMRREVAALSKRFIVAHPGSGGYDNTKAHQPVAPRIAN